jgi:hypothetical protein
MKLDYNIKQPLMPRKIGSKLSWSGNCGIAAGGEKVRKVVEKYIQQHERR